MIYALSGAIKYDKYKTFALETARSLLGREYGMTSLTGSRDMAADILNYLQTCPNESVPDVIEALWLGILAAGKSGDGYMFVDAQQFHNEVNEILRLERISFELVEGQMIDFESREMHESIILPTITLLAGRSGWEKVEVAYKKALDEIAHDPGDAITDATTALQQALQLRGCAGNSLGDLAKSAVSRHVLTSYDLKIIDWANADRGLKGDAHTSPDGARSDAWLAVHIVGALILRLASPETR